MSIGQNQRKKNVNKEINRNNHTNKCYKNISRQPNWMISNICPAMDPKRVPSNSDRNRGAKVRHPKYHRVRIRGWCNSLLFDRWEFFCGWPVGYKIGIWLG
jgi:hypothetical protein